MSRTRIIDPGEGADSPTYSSTDDNSRNSGIDTYSDRNSSSGSELLELAIYTLLVETRASERIDRYTKTLTVIATSYQAKVSLTRQRMIWKQ